MNKNEQRNAHLLFVEAAHDLDLESRGTPVPIGEMQRAHPEQYQNARKFINRWGESVKNVEISREQARKLSEILHSENGWIGSLPDVRNESSQGSPLNIALLEHLVAFERNPHAAKWLSSLQSVLSMHPVSIMTFLYLIRLERKHRAKESADKRHSQPKGARDNRAKMRKFWASGKYSSRDRCAEEECGGLNISYSSARKALRNTPDPHSRC